VLDPKARLGIYCRARVRARTNQLIDTGYDCTRRAVADGYCTQHYKQAHGRPPADSTTKEG
jgi:hypothetical protein